VNHSKNIDQYLLQSNPVLESFGNAKTGKTNNSSRFGKLLKIQFDSNNNDPNSFHIVSGSMESYLLEKSRVVMRMDDERNFHVFYQLLAGANMALRKKYRLKNAENYRYLNNEMSTEIDGIDDQADFQKLREALSAVGITHTDQDCVFRTVSAILSLGNVEFVEKTSEEDKKKQEERDRDRAEVLGIEVPSPGNSLDAAAQVAQAYVVENVAELLGVSRDALQQILVEHFIDMSAINNSGRFSSPQESIHSPRNLTQAIYARDAMAKAIYQRLFNWIVNRISESLLLNQGSDSDLLPFIGVLDIFGFEDFKLNGLEQLLINYANESLQLLYTKTVLVSEQALFLEEGLSDVCATGAVKYVLTL
jgi:myosin heavy subunit